jgi:hypothetical protein
VSNSEEIDCGTIEEACYRGMIESVIISLNQKYHLLRKPNYNPIAHVKIQWPIEGKSFLDYTRCIIECNALTIQAYCIEEQLIIDVFEPKAKYIPDIDQSSIHQSSTFYVNGFNESIYELADPTVHEKAFQLISNKLDKYLGESDG